MKTSLISNGARPDDSGADADLLSALAQFDAHADGEDWLSLVGALNRGEDAGAAFRDGVRAWAKRCARNRDEP